MEEVTLVEMIVAWLPVVLIIAAFIYYGRRAGSTNKRLVAYYAQSVEETRRQSELERIAAALEKRVSYSPFGPHSPHSLSP